MEQSWPDRQKELELALQAMVWQFAYRGHKGKSRMLHTGGLSALEEAFDALGWADPHNATEHSEGCAYKRCGKWTSIGTPTPAGYKHFCSGEHEQAFKATLGA